MPKKKKKEDEPVVTKPKDEAASKADLAKAKSELRAELNEKLDKLARAVNVDLDAMS
jgi:hypothetical protein